MHRLLPEAESLPATAGLPRRALRFYVLWPTVLGVLVTWVVIAAAALIVASAAEHLLARAGGSRDGCRSRSRGRRVRRSHSVAVVEERRVRCGRARTRDPLGHSGQLRGPALALSDPVARTAADPVPAPSGSRHHRRGLRVGLGCNALPDPQPRRRGRAALGRVVLAESGRAGRARKPCDPSHRHLTSPSPRHAAEHR